MAKQNNYKKTTFSGLIWQFAERVGAQLISTVVSIILARILVPEDYGVVALTTIFITVANVFITSGFGSALIQKKDSDDLDFSSVFYTGLFVSIILYVGLFFASPYIAKWFDEPLLSPILRVVGLQLPISALGSVQGAYISKNFLFKKFFLATLLGTIISAIVGIWMAYAGFGAWALVAQHMTNLVIDRFVLFITVKWRPKLCYSWKRTKTLFGYSWKLLGSGLLDVGYNELRGVIIGKKYSSVDLAYYNKGKSLPALVGENVNGPINGVLFPVMSAEQDDKQRVKQMTRRSIQTSCYLMFPILAGLAVVAPVLVPVLFTEKWNTCIPYMQMLCIVYAFWPIHTANLQAIKALGRSDLFLILEIVKKVLGVAVLLIAMWFGVFWIVMGTVFTTVISSIINAFPNKKLLKYSWIEQMRDLLPYMGLTVLMGVPVYLMNYLYTVFGWNMYLVLLLQVVAGIILYVGFSWLFKLEVFGYLLNTIKEFLGKRKSKGNGDRQMKKILIMGANPETVSLIIKAKKMGYKTYVTDNNPHAYAKKFADVPCNINGIDADAIVELVKKENIDAVIVGVAEALIPTYCEVCKRLNYPCFATLEQFDIMIHKDKFKQTCREYGVPVVEEFSISEPEKIVYPVVVKPVDSSSSKGISICTNQEQLDKAIEKALSFSPSKNILIEKYMDGIEAIVYYVIQDGKPTLVAMCDRYTSKEQEGITQLPSAYIFPSKHLEQYVAQTDEKVCNMLKGMNIQNGVLFLQAFIENGEVRIYEPGFRLNGAQEHIIVSHITGIDAKELLLNYAIKGKMSEEDISKLATPKFYGKWACKLSPLIKEGVIGKIEGVEEIKMIEGVVDVYPNYESGGVVKGLGTQRQMAANIFIVAEDKETLKVRAQKVIDSFKVFDENGNDMCLKPFDIRIFDTEYVTKKATN